MNRIEAHPRELKGTQNRSTFMTLHPEKVTMSESEPDKKSTVKFENLFPNIAAWVQDGWVEIGRDHYSASMVRLLDEGGMCWDWEEILQ